MQSLELAAGSLRVTYPDSYQVVPTPPEAARRGGPEAARRGGRKTGATGWKEPVGPTGEVTAPMLEAFAAQGMELVEPFELMPATPPAPSGRAGPRPGRQRKVKVALDLAEGQDAVILLEHDGFFSWRLPIGREAAPGGSRAHSPRSSRAGAEEPKAATASRVARFELDVRPGIPASPGTGAGTPTRSPTGAPTRSALRPVGDVVTGRLTAYVLSFASRLVPGAAISFLERDIHPGLVLMTGNEVKSWSRVDNLAQVPLPQGRPAKILLFVHGTFSSTVGTYGALTCTAQGRKLLKTAAGSYDAVLGFDHRTLSRDPLENAIDLHNRLKAQQPELSPSIDIVTHSRGALVARSLIEYLLPSSRWGADIGQVVFVAGTNAGTLLAEPESWKDFVDLYTNLAAGTARSIGFATGTAPAAEIVGGLVTGIGAFVTFLVTASITDRRIPGLAAMEPDGPFITGINGTQPGQPVAGTPWYVVSSDFEAQLFEDRHEPPELPRELVARLADGLADRLFGTKNDLVVDTASMGSVDLPSGGGFIKETLGFGTNSVVYHLNYFIQPRVCDGLRNWLT